jgi:hypothetical protein
MPRKSRKQQRNRAASDRVSHYQLVPSRAGPVHKFSRTWVASSVAVGTGTDTNGSVVLNPFNFPANFITFLQAWDLVRFDNIVVELTPTWNMNASTALPMIAYCPNYDDNSANPFDTIAGNSSARVHLFTRPIRVKCDAPVLITPTVATGSTANSMIAIGQWLNPAYFPLVQTLMPLLKFSIRQNGSAPGTGVVYVTIRMHYSAVQALQG